MLIEFSSFNYQMLFPLMFPIFIHIESIIKNNYLKKDNILFILFRHYLSHNLSIFFILIVKLRTLSNYFSKKKNIAVKRISWINPLNIQQKHLIRQKKEKSILFIILLLCVSLAPNI